MEHHTHTHTSASICRYRTPSAFYVWWRKSLLSLSLSLYFPLVLDLPPVSSPLSFILPHLFYLPLVILLSHSALRSSLPSQLFLRPHPWPASFPDGIAPPGVIPAPKTPSSTRACDYSTRNSKTNLRAKSRATVSEQKTLTNKDAIPLFILCLCSHFKASAYVTYRWPFSNPPFRPMTAFFQAAQLFSALASRPAGTWNLLEITDLSKHPVIFKFALFFQFRVSPRGWKSSPRGWIQVQTSRQSQAEHLRVTDQIESICVSKNCKVGVLKTCFRFRVGRSLMQDTN